MRIDDGELYATDFIALFEKFGYFVDTTGPDNSSANSKVERFHLDIKEGIRCMIFGVSWSYKNWNLAFYHYIHIYNTTAHGCEGKIPYNTVSGKVFDHSRTRIFGSRVTVLKNGKQPALGDHSRRGRFAGYSRSTKKILYVPDNNPGKLMETAHAVIDELNNGIKIDPPVTVALRKALGHEIVLGSDSRRPVQPTHYCGLFYGTHD